MQVVCEATQNSSSAVQVAAFECLVAIMAYYYHYMGFYMEQALFGVSGGESSIFNYVLTFRQKLTVLGMKHPDNNVAMQAVEFWSTVCDEEINLNKEAFQVPSRLRSFGQGLLLMILNRQASTERPQNSSPRTLPKWHCQSSYLSCSHS